MPDMDRRRTPALLDAFGFQVEANAHDGRAWERLPIAQELASIPLPSTSRQHPERQDLALGASGPYAFSIRSIRMAKRPSNWVRKLNALNTSIHPVLANHGALLLPGPSPFAEWAVDGPHPEPHRSGLLLVLPFARDNDFGRLHAAVRIALPVLSALAAATPFRDGRITGSHSARLRACLDLYEHHPERVGGFIPEAVFDPADHDREILGPIVKATAHRRPEEAPDPQFLNLRAACTFFEPNQIAIHVLDAQENAAADMAVLEFSIALVRALVHGRWSSNYLQRAWSSDDLMTIQLSTLRDGCRAIISNRDYLFMLGVLKQERASGTELLKHLFVELYGELSENARERIGLIIEHGCLAQRMLAKAGKRPGLERLRAIAAQLAACREGAAFA